jgi:glutathione peroxidase
MRKFLVIATLLFVVFISYVLLANKNDDMSVRQKILKSVYPVFTSFNRMIGTHSLVLVNKSGIKPPSSVYDLSVTMSNGQKRNMAEFKGRKLLIVNTASDCGYTGQYDELQQLYEKHKGQIEIIGFPANDFKEQEKGSDNDIMAFCKINYGVSFPLARKSVVKKGADQHVVYQWLTQKDKNGWNNKSPSWNFSKFLVNEEGMLTHYFDPAVSPLSKDIEEALQNQ